MNLSLEWAKETIPEGNSIVKVLYPDGDTDDIIRAILYADERSAKFTEIFSKAMEGKRPYEVARAIWVFIKSNVQYVEDEFGTQDVKSPAQLLTDSKGDCKSFAVFTGSVLQNLGIPYQYRFTSYSGVRDGKPKRVTHVYVVIPGEDIIIDAVYHRFNAQKKYTYKKDIMARIAYVEGFRKRDSRIGCDQVGQLSNEMKDVAKGFFATAVMVGVSLLFKGQKKVLSNN